MYLIWRMDTTAKGANKNTSPNEIHLQYFTSISRLMYGSTLEGMENNHTMTAIGPTKVYHLQVSGHISQRISVKKN